MAFNISKKRDTLEGENNKLRDDVNKFFQSEIQISSSDKEKLLKDLGSGKSLSNRKLQITASQLLFKYAEVFYREPDKFSSKDKILNTFIEEGGEKEKEIGNPLGLLLATGLDSTTILHNLFRPEPVGNSPFALHEENFPKIKPLLDFLLHLQPDLLTTLDNQKRTPLFLSMNSENTSKEAKTYIINYLCKNAGCEKPVMTKAIESLTVIGSMENGYRCHALHLAIKNDVYIDESVLRDLNLRGPIGKARDEKGGGRVRLEEPDSDGNSPLHLALTSPFSKEKISWAKSLATLCPKLLKTRSISGTDKNGGLTPLQYFTEQKKRSTTEKKGDTDQVPEKNDGITELEDFLKRQCLRICHDDSEVKSIMYGKNNKFQVSLNFEQYNTISGMLLNKLTQHYRLDTTLRCVCIPKIKVEWDPDSANSQKKAKEWGFAELFMIFDWLKGKRYVKKLMEVVVDDFEDEDRTSHTDEAIVQCLQNLQIESWNWRRMDIPVDVISRVSKDLIRVVNLYCSGLKAVLQSWSDKEGLPRLKNLEEVYLETHQGRETLKTMANYVKDFEEELKSNFLSVNGKKLVKVECKPVKPAPKNNNKVVGDSTEEKPNIENKEEEEWITCVDNFARFVEKIRPESSHKRQIKIALIDDGVQFDHDGLNDSIETGETWARETPFSWGKPKPGYRKTYFTSHRGHGTVMAWYIRRVFPDVRLVVAKLEPQVNPRGGEPVTFSIDSAAKAIQWAVDEDVDIISMSWAIDAQPNDPEVRYKELQTAIQTASRKNILLFCANPDKGESEPDPKTYPKCPPDVNRIFCIGAAKNGRRWEKIATNDKTCDFFLPGVRLGIELKGPIDSPNKVSSKLKDHSGSSLSCALAAGLAGMILHCAQLSGSTTSEYQWLKSHTGMQGAFRSFHITEGGWLPVERIFGQKSLESLSHDDAKREALKEDVVGKLLSSMPREQRRSSEEEE